MPAVSVIMPAYNAVGYIRDAISSVLGQDFQDWELIVVDDGSSDGTADVAATYTGQVRCQRIPHSGANVARNHGIAASSGDFLAFLDADDRWQPNKLRAQVDALREHPQAGACFAGTLDVNELNGRSWVRQRRFGHDVVADLLLYSNFLGPTSALMVRRETMQQIGPFDESLTQSQDYELCLRLAKATELVLLPEPLVIYRIHGRNMTRNVARFEANALAILRRFFAEEENRARWGHLRRAALSNHYWFFAGAYLENRDWPNFARSFARSLAWNPGKVITLAPTVRKRLAQRLSPA